jgi:hypothetical protein
MGAFGKREVGNAVGGNLQKMLKVILELIAMAFLFAASPRPLLFTVGEANGLELRQNRLSRS